MARIDKIRQMLAAEPEDIFLRYALAMELDSAGDLEQSLDLFRQLMRTEPPHVPSFFRTAQILVRTGVNDEATQVLEAGIAHALSQNDTHAAGEMTELLQQIRSASDEI